MPSLRACARADKQRVEIINKTFQFRCVILNGFCNGSLDSVTCLAESNHVIIPCRVSDLGHDIVLTVMQINVNEIHACMGIFVAREDSTSK